MGNNGGLRKRQLFCFASTIFTILIRTTNIIMNITTYKQFQNFFVIWWQRRGGRGKSGGNNEKEGGRYQNNGTKGCIEVL